MPCADLKVNTSLHNKAEFATNYNQHSHNEGNDLCSPFCVCNCCSVQILTYFPVTTFNFPIGLEVIKLQLPGYKSISYSNFYGSIWQPPQIV